MSHSSSTAIALVEICHRLSAKGFVAATDGNVSCRLENGHILATRSAVGKGLVTEADLVETDMTGRPVSSTLRPSTELQMHLHIYAHRKEINAVVHAHPPYATGFAAARIALDQCLLPEVVVGLGSVPLAQYATPSTPEVPNSLQPYVMTHDAILLANHGVVAYGTDAWDAYFKMEKVEQAAMITFVARMLGGENRLSEEEMEKLRSVSKASYGRDIPMPAPCKTEESRAQDDSDDDTIRRIVREMITQR